jgi:hypothetical protein
VRVWIGEFGVGKGVFFGLDLVGFWVKMGRF